jgi:hypothetical protein
VPVLAEKCRSKLYWKYSLQIFKFKDIVGFSLMSIKPLGGQT